MSEISLFEHNEKAYELLNESLKTSKFATINHATGTGKSFIALKYLYENRDKRCLYISPTYPIIDQLIDSCSGIGIDPKELNLDTMIYRNLLGLDMNEIFEKYDVIILDEYHRTGAIKTQKQIKKLKELIAQSEKDKKMIGLTATPIRYLDDERDMTNEIFNGVVASNLSLSEAMLDELLPIPLVINSRISCRKPYNNIKRRADKLYPGQIKDFVDEKLSGIGDKVDNGEVDYQELLKKYIKEKDGKYVVFCSTINEAKMYYAVADKWFEHIGKIKKYQVHSGQTKEKNREILRQFNNDNSGMSLLFCVDVLNEGVHVKNIDGVIMLRRTTSPIIYFQQIGRALSFSGRKKQIKIFDLVNNFANHNAIYAIYKELREELQKKIELHPENKQKYEELIKRFIIIDETREIIEQLSEVSKYLTREKIIQSKVDYAIEKLISLADIPLNNKNAKEIEDINLILERYYKFVTVEQLDKLLDLNILLPKELLMIVDNREENLNGYTSIYEKEKHEFNLVNFIVKFIDINKRLPSQFSTYDSEKRLGKLYYESVSDFSEEQSAVIKEALKRNNVALEVWEKILLNEKINENDLDELIIEAREYLESDRVLPKYLYDSLYMITIKYDENSYIEEITNILNDADELHKRKLRPKLYEKKIVDDIIKFLTENQCLLENLPDELKVKLISLSSESKFYLSLRYKRINKTIINEQIFLEDIESVKAFCSEINESSDTIVEDYYSKLELDKKVNKCLLKIANFKTENNRLPKEDSENLEESDLAREFSSYVEMGKIGDKLLTLLEENKLIDASIEEVIRDICTTNFDKIHEREKMLREKFKSSRKGIYSDKLGLDKKVSLEDFCTSMLSIDDEGIKKCRDILELERDINENALKIIDFKRENNKMPEKESENIDEIELASKFEQLEEIDKVFAKELNALYDGNGLVAFHQIKEELIRAEIVANLLELKTREAILKVVEFFNKFGRKPLNNSKNPVEVEIASIYQKLVVENLADRYLDILNKKLNNRKNLKGTYQAYIKNIKEGR